MSSPHTRQRKVLLAYLGEQPDELLSVCQIAHALQDEKISLSAAYRNLSQMEEEEKIRRNTRRGGQEYFYQYINVEGCNGMLHMTCMKCGWAFHTADDNAALFAKHLALREKVVLDTRKNIFYGLCATCEEN